MMKKYIILVVLTLITMNVTGQVTITHKKSTASKTEFKIKQPSSPLDNYIHKYVLGDHLFGIQWLWFNDSDFGHVKITKSQNGTYKCIGVQRSNSDYVTINGTIKVLSKYHLKFSGKIICRLKQFDNGNEYIREGTFDFEASSGSHYWRLQQDEAYVNGKYSRSDYIDIYFKVNAPNAE